MADLLSAFAGPAQIGDSTPNPDVDEAMGYGANPNDSWAQSFSKGLSSSMFRNSDEGRKLTTEFAKQKLANKLALDLEERKQQIAQKYPTYQAESTPWGATRVFNPKTGEVHDTGGGPAADPNSPEGQNYALWQATNKEKLEAAKQAVDPEIVAANKANALAKPKLTQANIDYINTVKPDIAKAMAGAATQNANTRANPPAPKHTLSPADEQTINNIAFENVMHMKSTSPMAFTAISKVQKDPALQKAIQDEKERLRSQWSAGVPQAGGLASPGAAPDLSGLINPLQVDD